MSDRKAYAAAHYLAHRDEVRAKHAAHYAAHRGEIKAKQAVYQVAHRAEHAAYYAARRAEKRAWQAAYNAAHPEARRAYSAAYTASHRVERRELEHRRRARKARNGVFVVLPRDWRRTLERYGHACAYCGSRGPLTQDHVVPLSRGGRHSIGNLVPACGRCNSSKRNKLLVEWRARKAVAA